METNATNSAIGWAHFIPHTATADISSCVTAAKRTQDYIHTKQM